MKDDQKRRPINLFSDKPKLQNSKIDPLISITQPVKREQPVNLFIPMSNLKNEKIGPLLSMTKPDIKQGQPTVNLFIPMSNLKNRDIDPLIPTLKLNTKDVPNSSGQIQDIVDQPIKTTIREHNIDSKDILVDHPQTRTDIRRIRGYNSKVTGKMTNMTNEISPEEAKLVAISILPTVNNWITTSMFERAHLRVSDIANIIPSVKRAGSTPDTYCKIAEAMFKHGIATDLRKDRNSNMLLSFRSLKHNEKPPSSEICYARWEMIKLLEFEDVKRLEFEDNEIDNLSQKDAETILKELK